MSVYQVVAPAAAFTVTTTISTGTFAACPTNVFQVDNTNASVYAYVNVFTTNAAVANGFNHPATAGGQTGLSLCIPPSQSRILVGDFAVTGGGQNLYVNYVTNSGTGSVIFTPISGQRPETL